MRFSPDGTRLASGGGDGIVRIWDSTSGKELLTFKGHDNGISDVCFSPDGTRLASAGGDRTVKVWACGSGQETLSCKHTSAEVKGMCFSPEGRRLAAASPSGVQVWDSSSGQELLSLKSDTLSFDTVCFSPDSTRLAAAGYAPLAPGGVKVWDSTTGQELLALKGDGRSVCFSPDGTRLASAGGEGMVRVWDSGNGKELLTLKLHNAAFSSIGFSPDGTRLATGRFDGPVHVWDGTTGQEILTLKGHVGRVNSVCFSPDGTRLASGGKDWTVRVWDSTSGQQLLTLKEDTASFSSVCFSPDGTRLAAAAGASGKSGEVKVWETRPVPAAVLRERALMEEVDRLYLRLLLKELVLCEIRTDPWLSKADRRFALQVARTRAEYVYKLNQAAWDVVRRAGGKKEGYALALRYAEAAVRGVHGPAFGAYLNTVGVAQYRMGRYAAALGTLSQSSKLNEVTFKSPQPADFAFLAMTQHQLGKKDEAKATLARLRKVMKQERWAKDAEAQGFLREAEETLQQKPASETTKDTKKEN